MQTYDPAIHDQQLFELTGELVRKGCYTLQALILLGLIEHGIEKDTIKIARSITRRIQEHADSLPAAVGASISNQALIAFKAGSSTDPGGFLLIDWSNPADVREPEYDVLHQ